MMKILRPHRAGLVIVLLLALTTCGTGGKNGASGRGAQNRDWHLVDPTKEGGKAIKFPISIEMCALAGQEEVPLWR